MTGAEAFEIADRKARYSDYDWVVWKDKTGLFNAERASVESIKKALLAVGTQGHFTIVQSRTKWHHICSWRIGVNAMNHLRSGYYY